MTDKFQLKIYVVIAIIIFVIQAIIAHQFIITNDEAYYLAFAKNLQLSYIDSPPFVAYLTWLQNHLNLNSRFSLRFIVIVLHFISSLFLLKIVSNNYQYQNNSITKTNAQKSLLITFLLSYLAPIFGLYGIFILPDAGLILSLSIMLYFADNIYQHRNISYWQSLGLGLGLGLGLLSKYHIIPLGGGMLLGLILSLLPSTSKKHLWYCGLIIICTSLIISAPLWLWNYYYHFASFKFQLQHGYAKGNWSLSSLLLFFITSILYISPWFTYFLLKFGLLKDKKLYIMIPFGSLTLILIVSSLLKNVLGHWIAPAFWLLIPYSSIYIIKSASELTQKIITMFFIFTTIIWLVIPLAIASNCFRYFHDLSNYSDLLLWKDIKDILQSSPQFTNNIVELNQKNIAYHNTVSCSSNKQLIGTTDWMFTAQFEYINLAQQLQQKFHQQYQILNLNIEHANFYLWRDQLELYANCPILIISYRPLPQYLESIMQINNETIINNIKNYKDIELHLIMGVLKDSITISQAKNQVLYSGHY